MKLNGSMSLDGRFYLTHRRGDVILSETEVHNTTTNAGFKDVASAINTATGAGFTYLEVGSSATAAAAANTTLAAAITAAGMARAAATCTKVTTTVSGDTAQLLHTFTATATQAVKEVGVFDASSAGNMLARTTFTAKNMESGDTIACTYKIKVA